MARIFFDTEFLEDGKTIAPISIGMVRADGKEYYAEFADAPFDRIAKEPWLMQNVVPYLDGNNLKSRERIRKEILEFVGPSPSFWAYYADYDWVLLCQLYGRMIDLPDGWPMFCNDLRQMTGTIKLPEQTSSEHNALNDARWLRDCYEWYRGRVHLCQH
jgi:hypothetical protein